LAIQPDRLHHCQRNGGRADHGDRKNSQIAFIKDIYLEYFHEYRTFPPTQTSGLTLHIIILVVLFIIATFGFVTLASAEVGPSFLISLLISLFSFAPIPFFVYRAYSLWKAEYYIDRDSLAIHWGLRIEDIPLNDIEWIRPADDLSVPLALPAIPLPGGLLGVRRHPDLGAVEFIASDASKLLLVATAKRIFAISPADPAALAQTFARATEMGSLAPVEANRSTHPLSSHRRGKAGWRAISGYRRSS
jgi:hypothetical protein